MHILSLLAYVSFTLHSGTVWRKLVMLDFVEDSEPDSRFPGIGGRSLIGGLALTGGDRSSTGVLVDVCQCTDGLSATQNDRGAAERFSTLQDSNPCRPTLCDSR